jgi:hypothetical protein
MQVVIAVVLIVAVVVTVGAGMLEFFSPQRVQTRKAVKANVDALLTARKQLGIAKQALVKVASNTSGNPTLDAQIALENISQLELNELESN